MKIRTEILQDMVAKSIQGAGNNKMIPLTSLIGIELKDKNLILTTTDGSNQFKINNAVELDPINGPVDKQSFYTIINADTFAKLVSRTTTEFVELENKENYLEVIGNGEYKFEIAINEEGEMVKFPDIENIQGEELAINLNDLKEAINISKASVAKTMEVPCLTGYYIADNLIATDRQMVCELNNNLVTTPLLISSEMAELLLLVEGDEIVELVKKDNDLIFYNKNYTIAGKELEGKDIYPVAAIENLVKLDYTDSIEVPKQDILAVLDRMSLFVSEYDKGGVYLKFSVAGLTIRSQKSNAVEEILDEKVNKRIDFECLADIEMLKSQITAITSDVVKIYYGQPKSLKIVDGNCTLVLSLLEKAE